VSIRRGGQDDAGSELNSRQDGIPLAFGAMRAADGGEHTASVPKPKGDDEKLSIYWRVFGGTILSICALVGVTLFNNLNSTLADFRSAIDRANETRAKADGEIRAELAKMAETRVDLIRKDEVQTRVTNIYERIQGLQNQNNTQNANLTSVKTEIDGLKERVNRSGSDIDAVKKDMATALDLLRKDQSATTDALKKDIAAMDGIKERLANLAVDLKAARDDFKKRKKDVEKNQSYAFERRHPPEAQCKQLEDNVKDMQKALQECRERVARLDALAAAPAPAPVTPASAVNPTPAPVSAAKRSQPAKPETAPAPKAVPPAEGETPEDEKPAKKD
jgi:predicted  nucleic acid-binding Zn-ribbon protein